VRAAARPREVIVARAFFLRVWGFRWTPCTELRARARTDPSYPTSAATLRLMERRSEPRLPLDALARAPSAHVIAAADDRIAARGSKMRACSEGPPPIRERAAARRTVSHFRILEQVGAGGMGVVYRATDERLEREVALKLLPAGACRRRRPHRCRAKRRTLSRLNHPAIATLYDVGEEATRTTW
jgi:hypothetical protein